MPRMAKIQKRIAPSHMCRLDKSPSIHRRPCAIVGLMPHPKAKVYKSPVPLSLWIKAVTIAVAALFFILFAVWQSAKTIINAKITGTVVSKEFKPLDQAEKQITIHRTGIVRTDAVEGDYIITVAVPQPSGKTKEYTVWLNDKQRYESTKVGDSFDVGPYLVKEPVQKK